MLTSYTFTSRQPDEDCQEEAVNKKAEEFGFNRFDRYEHSQYWTKLDGTHVIESFFQRNGGDEKLHIICLNPLKKKLVDAAISHN